MRSGIHITSSCLLREAERESEKERRRREERGERKEEIGRDGLLCLSLIMVIIIHLVVISTVTHLYSFSILTLLPNISLITPLIACRNGMQARHDGSVVVGLESRVQSLQGGGFRGSGFHPVY